MLITARWLTTKPAVGTREILAEFPALAERTFTIDTRPVPLADVEQAWADAVNSPHRIVITPTA